MAGRRRGMLKRKAELHAAGARHILTSELLRYEQLLFGAAASTNVNRLREAEDLVAHHQQDQRGGRPGATGETLARSRTAGGGPATRSPGTACSSAKRRPPPAAHLPSPAGVGSSSSSSEPAGRPEHDGPEWSMAHGACPLDIPPLPGTMASAFQGVKEEPVKEEPVDVKSEPFHPLPTETIQQRVARGAERRLLRSSGHAPDDPCEGWSRSPPDFSQTDLSISELGGRQEALGLDYASITFDQESPHGQLNGCNVGDVVAPGPVPIQEGPSESSQFSLAQRRIVQSNEQLVQEVRAFRQEYIESRRETASILHSIAEALSGVCNSLSEIRDLYLRQQAVRVLSPEDPEQL